MALQTSCIRCQGAIASAEVLEDKTSNKVGNPTGSLLSLLARQQRRASEDTAPKANTPLEQLVDQKHVLEVVLASKPMPY